MLAVAEPFFEDLIAADGEVPDVFGEVAPVGGVVEVDVVGGFAEEGGVRGFGLFLGAIGAGEEFAFAGHGDAALAGMAPTGGEAEDGGGLRGPRGRRLQGNCVRSVPHSPYVGGFVRPVAAFRSLLTARLR